jgi:hypothetical protein
LICLPLLVLLAMQASPPSVEFARGKTAFARGEYVRAIEILRPLLYPEPQLPSEGEIVTAHRMLGTAYLYQRQNDQAAQEFRRLLQLRPDYRMDRLLDPPMVADFFNAVVKQQEAELAELDRRRREAEEYERQRALAARAGPTIIEKHYIRNSLAVSFIPFGAGQFQNGQRRKGWWFLGTQAALASISVGAFVTNFALYGINPQLPCQQADRSVQEGACPPGTAEAPDRSRSRNITRVQVASGALFFATAIWGVTDAVLNFQPMVTVTTPVLPPSAKPEPAPPRKLGLGQPHLSPLLLGDGGLGGAFGFRF